MQGGHHTDVQNAKVEIVSVESLKPNEGYEIYVGFDDNDNVLNQNVVLLNNNGELLETIDPPNGNDVSIALLLSLPYPTLICHSHYLIINKL